MSLEALSGEDWEKVLRGKEEIGYAWVTPEVRGGKLEVGETLALEEPSEDTAGGSVGSIRLNTGRLTPEQVDLVLTHLPVDMSFIDEDDQVAYYSAGKGKGRISPRSQGVIGRKVHNCHPPKSVHIVQKILDAFKAGRKDVAEFYLPDGRSVHSHQVLRGA